jgi:hypothetical protein
MHISSTGPAAPVQIPAPGSSKVVPPGLARRGLDLPPGIAKKLDAGGTMPAGIARRFPAATVQPGASVEPSSSPETSPPTPGTAPDGVAQTADSSTSGNTNPSVDLLV